MFMAESEFQAIADQIDELEDALQEWDIKGNAARGCRGFTKSLSS